MVTQEIFRCLGDPIRRAIVEILALSSRSVTEIASHFEVSRPAVSRHLRVLRDAGVVSETRSGRERIYRLETRALDAAVEWLSAAAAGRVTAPSERLETDVTSRPAPVLAIEEEETDWRQW